MEAVSLKQITVEGATEARLGIFTSPPSFSTLSPTRERVRAKRAGEGVKITMLYVTPPPPLIRFAAQASRVGKG